MTDDRCLSPEDVTAVMEQIRSSVETRRPTFQSTTTSLDAQHLMLLNLLTVSKQHLALAESRAQPRHQWPKKLRRFPWSLLTPLHKLGLKVLNGVFRDQREVNLNLIQALRKHAELQRLQIYELQAWQMHQKQTMAHLEARLQSLESQVVRD